MLAFKEMFYYNSIDNMNWERMTQCIINIS